MNVSPEHVFTLHMYGPVESTKISLWDFSTIFISGLHNLVTASTRRKNCYRKIVFGLVVRKVLELCLLLKRSICPSPALCFAVPVYRGIFASPPLTIDMTRSNSMSLWALTAIAMTDICAVWRNFASLYVYSLYRSISLLFN